MCIRDSPCVKLQGGLQFTGQQQSKGNSYRVDVFVQHVDFENSKLSGYLKIHELTEKYPDLTTYFEGEIIGDDIISSQTNGMRMKTLTGDTGISLKDSSSSHKVSPLTLSDMSSWRSLTLSS